MLNIYISISLLVMLAIMFFQDLKFRGISWYGFPVLGLLLALSNTHLNFLDCACNIAFITMVYTLLTGWFSLRHKKFINLLELHMGLGDLLFLICISFYFSPISFFFFYLVSTVLISTGVWVYLWIVRPKQYTVPLAGLMSLVLIAGIVASWVGGTELYRIDLFQSHVL